MAQANKTAISIDELVLVFTASLLIIINSLFMKRPD
jgi:hypothetical protein